MRQQESGFALISVLVILIVATALAAAALGLARSSVVSAANYSTDIEGGHAAEAAISLAVIRLSDSEGYGIADVTRSPVHVNGWRVSIRIEDEAGKLDINRAVEGRVESALVGLGVDRRVAQTALRAGKGRFLALDDLAQQLGVPADALPRWRSRLTVHGTAEPQAAAIRSSLETYRIVALAHRGDLVAGRWAMVRLSPGFASPFEWLERGSDIYTP